MKDDKTTKKNITSTTLKCLTLTIILFVKLS